MFKKGFRKDFFDEVEDVDFSGYLEEEDDIEFVDKKKVKRVFIAS